MLGELRRTLIALIAVSLSVSFVQAEPIGWRSDGTGSYPLAKPPLEWSPTKNVIWKAAMPGASNSQPVLLGPRIFICAEPCTLLCLNRDDGKILWQKSCGYADLDLDSITREKLKLEQVEVEKLNKQHSALGRESELLRRKLKDDPADKAVIEKQVDALRAKMDEVKALKLKYPLANRYTEPGKQGTAGYSTPTPVTDGKDVFVAFGNGLVACYDLEGNRKWLKLIEHSTASFAHSNSPLLVGDKLLIHFADLVALRIHDGSEIWRVKKPPTHGTSVVASVGGVEAAITPHGTVVRVHDGVILAEGLGSCGANSPILHEGKVYFLRNSATAAQLPPTLAEPAKIPLLWKSKIKGGGYWFPSPVLHQGLIYAIDDRGNFSVIDAKEGKLVYEQSIDIGGTHYPSISMAHDRVYVSSDNGATVVIKAGREYVELARNQLEPFRSSLVFQGNRMYVRTQKSLYCIGE